ASSARLAPLSFPSLEHATILPRIPLRAVHLELRRAAGARAATREVRRRATPDPILIDFAHYRVGRHRRVIGIPARAEESCFLACVTHEQDRTPRSLGALSAGEGLGDLKNRPRASSVR